MSRYQIGNKQGAHLGIYEGDTPDAALDAMARDAGYASYRDACSITLTDVTDDELDAEVERCRGQMYVVPIEGPASRKDARRVIIAEEDRP